ncbi:MAG: Undecaprenyl-phosphate mannosyltransferase [Syntrophomonadaceae bacterium]|nr:Undecaprenyl-phosphate mannosyltransferase [Bacillota bacterium]
MGLKMVSQPGEAKILVIVPAHNEEDNILRTLREIREKASYVDILVVNDGSTDRTSEIVRNNGSVIIDLPFNMGIGAAVQTGFKVALEREYDIAIQIDADGQHNPSYIPMLCEPILKGDADVVIGSRYKEKSNYKTNIVRLAGIKFFSWLASMITRQKITDTTSGLRALNQNAIALFSKEYPTEFPDAEAIILLGYRGFRVSEIPVEMRKRQGGESFFSLLRFLRYPPKNLFSIIHLVLRERKRGNLPYKRK